MLSMVNKSNKTLRLPLLPKLSQLRSTPTVDITRRMLLHSTVPSMLKLRARAVFSKRMLPISTVTRSQIPAKDPTRSTKKLWLPMPEPTNNSLPVTLTSNVSESMRITSLATLTSKRMLSASTLCLLNTLRKGQKDPSPQ